MKKHQEEIRNKLINSKLITREQGNQIDAYKKLSIFSLHNELRTLLYLSVSLFTAGIGIIIYQNIDSIGHIALLLALFIIICVCFFMSFQKAPHFQKTETFFSNSLFDYLIVLAYILTCTFIGYLQFQYSIFGNQFGLATLIPTLIGLGCAYYFDNKSILTIAITGLAAFIGITVKPQMLLQWDTFNLNTLGYPSILLGAVLVLWSIYCDTIDLKKHFKLIFTTYALHIISLACICNLLSYTNRVPFAIFLLLSTYYFIKTSIKIKAISIYIFTILYGYIGLNIILFMLLERLDFSNLFELFIFLLPIYFILSIIGFIKSIKKFKQ